MLRASAKATEQAPRTMKNAIALLREVIGIRQLDSSEAAEVSQRGQLE